MKKLLVLVVVATACSFTALYAQPPGGGQFDPAQMIARIKENLKDLKLTPAQEDSVVAVLTDRSIRQSVYNGANPRDLSDEVRQAKQKQVGELQQARLVKAGLTAEQAKEVIAKAAFGRGPSGGGRPQGGSGNKK
jgi:hypothetical protein